MCSSIEQQDTNTKLLHHIKNEVCYSNKYNGFGITKGDTRTIKMQRLELRREQTNRFKWDIKNPISTIKITILDLIYNNRLNSTTNEFNNEL